MTIKLVAADLNYLLQQVNIGADYTKLVSPLDPNGVHEVDGANNNLVGGFDVNGNYVGGNINPGWGQADQPFPRMFYTDTPGQTAYGYASGDYLNAVADPFGQMPTILESGNYVLNPDWTPTFSTEPGTSARTITQLIASSDIDPTSPTFNPAALAAMEALGGQPVGTSNTVVGTATTAKMPDPGILGGIPFNEWNVAFGQFFDHGLDFIQKDGGFVLIQMSPTDPLYNPAMPFMFLNRASLANDAEDFVVDPMTGAMTLVSTATPIFNNNTGLLIEQSQTYGSHRSINVLVRQYDVDGNFTGKLITSAEDMTAPDATDLVTYPGGDTDPAYLADLAAYDKADHNLATWADMKVNAARLGIELLDTDVANAPSIKATTTGAIAFTAQQGVMYRSDMSIADMGTDYNSDNDPFERDADGNVVFSNQAILSDIAFGANPSQGPYDPALLESHYVSGDHRANENFGLTAVHHVFHEEHNYEVDAIKVAAIRDYLASGDTQYLLGGYNDINGNSVTGYLVDGTNLGSGAMEALNGLSVTSTDQEILDAVDGTYALNWNTEFLYQAARIITESEYNHIAIDQYVGGLVALPEFVSYSTDVNMGVTLEFAQAVFRLGHSQLNETIQVAIPDADGNEPSTPNWTPTYEAVNLFDAFLNPALYGNYGPADIALGLMQQQANNIDEFVTSALQQSLVGIGLDLGALNVTRGRDVGLPTLNEMRQQIYLGLQQNTNGTGSGIAPYSSWEDWGGHLRTPESLANFIAAYGRDNDNYHLVDLRVAYETGNVTGSYLLDPSDPTSTVTYDVSSYVTDPSGLITVQDLRNNAQVNIVDAAAGGDATAINFMRGTGQPVFDPTTGTWNINDPANGGDQGFWDIDLWIGGLAEQPLFDGPLGTTFTMVMADFGQKMQDGDRFYYLYRMPTGQHLGDQIIGEQFADLIQRSTGLEHTGDAFGYQSGTYMLDGTYEGQTHDNDYDGTGAGDLYGDNDYFNAIYEALPDRVTNIVVENSSFEYPVATLTTPNNVGTYQPGPVAGWSTVDPTGTVLPDGNTDGHVGTFRPDEVVIPQDGHEGPQNAFISGGGYALDQDTGQPAIAGETYEVSVNIGNRNGTTPFAGEVQIVTESGVVIGQATFAQVAGTGVDYVVPEHSWRPIIATAVVDPAYDGEKLHVRIVNTSPTGYAPIFLDDVRLNEITPSAGSANDGHIVIAGLSGNDYIVGALGDDYIYGDAGNDVIEGAQGNDHLYGGDGDDWITDYENDDFIHGGAGDDYINAGPGVLDTSHGGAGDDEVHGGDGVDEVYGEEGDDRLYGDGDTDIIFGEDGNDYMNGGDSVDEMFGGNGNDWMQGGVGDDNINGGSGNDLMEGGVGATANDGDRLNGDTAPNALPVIEYNGDGTEGDMDIVSYERVQYAVYADLQTSNGNGTSSNLLDTYALDEGLVGTGSNDILTGADANGASGNGFNNYLVGGAGDDRLVGLGDDAVEAEGQIDYIFGDSVIVDNSLYWMGDVRHTLSGHGDIDMTTTTYKGLTVVNGMIDNWHGTGETRVLFTDGTLGHILGDNADGTHPYGDEDVAVYQGPSSQYALTLGDVVNGEQSIKITDSNAARDGIDILVGVEYAEFANGERVSLSLADVSEIYWEGNEPSGNNNPGNNQVIAQLGSNTPFFSTPTYELVSASVGDTIAVDPDGTVRTISNVPNDSTLDIVVRVTANDINGLPVMVDKAYSIVSDGNMTSMDRSGETTSQVVYARGGGDNLIGSDLDDTLFGQGGSDTIAGGLGDDAIWGGANDDTIDGGEGDDTIVWAGNGGSNDGFDVVDGGTNSSVGDRFVVQADGLIDIYTLAAYLAAFPAYVAQPTTEIVITRDGTVIAELDNIEELTVRGAPLTGDNRNGVLDTPVNVAVHGDFTQTSLKYSTITVDGGDGDDSVDISELTSDHRIVFHGGAGINSFLGGQRPQDVVENGQADFMVNAQAEAEDGSSEEEDEYEDAGNSPATPATPATPAAASASDTSAGDDIILGTEEADALMGTAAAEVISGLGGADTVLAGDGGDTVSGNDGDDILKAGAGADVVFGGAGNDMVFGGEGDDMLFGNEGEDVIFGDEGNDVIDAGADDDLVHGGSGDDLILASAGDGNDSYWGDEGSDTIDYSALSVDVTIDLGSGMLDRGTVSAGGETDTLYSIENALTGTGNDTFIAGDAANVMDGGSGNDMFVFNSVLSADGDMITGFTIGDTIDLSGIDANAGASGNQSFTLISGSTFSAAGQLSVTVENRADGDHTLIRGDVTGDGTADFTIDVEGRHDLDESSFHGVG